MPRPPQTITPTPSQKPSQHSEPNSSVSSTSEPVIQETPQFPSRKPKEPRLSTMSEAQIMEKLSNPLKN